VGDASIRYRNVFRVADDFGHVYWGFSCETCEQKDSSTYPLGAMYRDWVTLKTLILEMVYFVHMYSGDGTIKPDWLDWLG
jgi:hypothetical protein